MNWAACSKGSEKELTYHTTNVYEVRTNLKLFATLTSL